MVQKENNSPGKFAYPPGAEYSNRSIPFPQHAEFPHTSSHSLSQSDTFPSSGSKHAIRCSQQTLINTHSLWHLTHTLRLHWCSSCWTLFLYFISLRLFLYSLLSFPSLLACWSYLSLGSLSPSFRRAHSLPLSLVVFTQFVCMSLCASYWMTSALPCYLPPGLSSPPDSSPSLPQ